VTYATLDNLVQRYSARTLVQVTDRATPPTGQVDQAVVDRALADTDAMIDGYLSARYRLPMATVPPLLVDLAEVISIYKLYRDVPTEKVKQDYRDALAMLGRIADGSVRLPIDGIDAPANVEGGVRVADRPKALSTDSLKGFV
jgi:phage gp36-like protein